jgi:hypothetical protein
MEGMGWGGAGRDSHHGEEGAQKREGEEWRQLAAAMMEVGRRGGTAKEPGRHRDLAGVGENECVRESQRGEDNV